MRNDAITDAKKHLPRLVQDVEAGDAVTLLRRGKPVAVLVSVAEYQRIRAAVPLTPWQALLRARAHLTDAGTDSDDAFEDVRVRNTGRDPHL